MAGMFRPPSTATQTALTGFKDTGGNARSIIIYGTQGTDRFNDSNTIKQGQIGKGDTPVTRQDANIEQPFTSGGNEDNKQNLSVYGYIQANGEINYNFLISNAFEAGIVKEVCSFIQMRDSPSVATKEFMLTRDVLNPVVNFIQAENIFVEFSILL